MADLGASIVIAFLEAEMARGTDGAVFYDEDAGSVEFRRLHQIDAELYEHIEDLLTDEPQHGIVVETCAGHSSVWLIPRRMLTTMVKTSAVLLNQTELPIWATLRAAGRQTKH